MQKIAKIFIVLLLNQFTNLLTSDYFRDASRIMNEYQSRKNKENSEIEYLNIELNYLFSFVRKNLESINQFNNYFKDHLKEHFIPEIQNIIKSYCVELELYESSCLKLDEIITRLFEANGHFDTNILLAKTAQIYIDRFIDILKNLKKDYTEEEIGKLLEQFDFQKKRATSLIEHIADIKKLYNDGLI